MHEPTRLVLVNSVKFVISKVNSLVCDFYMPYLIISSELGKYSFRY